ncbi:MAG TPA: ABC transporter permease, partial [Pararobbsia sp.]|nr:ABC transporter permease [Pararobbsia sp.]
MNATPASPIAKPKAKLTDHLPPLTLLGPLIALVLACIFFISQTPRFLSVQNLSLILQQSMVVGIIAIGQTLIVLTAGIDLSCGMVMALGSVVMSKVAVANGVNPFVSIVLGVAVCTLFGLINGLLVTRVKLPAFIVTLGTLNIAFAITQIYSNAESISNLPAPLTFFGNTFGIGAGTVTYGTVLMLVLYLLTWFVLRETAP